jgi:hypothetical protein
MEHNLKVQGHMAGLLVVCLCIAGFCFASPVSTLNISNHYGVRVLLDTVPLRDTVPKERPKRGITRYINILTDRQQRDSLLANLSRPAPSARLNDSLALKRKANKFSPYRGKVIRKIYFNRLDVFGTEFLDTSVTRSASIVRFANRTHLNTQEWVIRQALFFHPGDTVNVYKLLDNERYLRNLAFIQDARIYVVNNYKEADSIDIVVLTKDVFEYGGTLNNLTNTSISASIYNNNLLGAGQQVLVGYKWDETYRPQHRGEVSYSKYNLGGTFTDVTIGYSALNDRPTADTGVYERSYFFSAYHPLYTSWARFTGGLSLEHSSSINIYSFPDSVYRNYDYNIVDVWAGYNFRNQFKTSGQTSEKPNIAVLGRSFNMDFEKKPWQAKYQMDPNYNDHRYFLGQFVLFHSDFFKTNYFLGFGRTEDIPSGYNASFSAGVDNWVGLKRLYTAIQGQKFWLMRNNNLLSTQIGIGTFWENGVAQDAVFHFQWNYYSNLWHLGQQKIRQFLTLDYLGCPNPVLYKPLNINRENGILGYRNTTLNGYQRLNMSAQTMYYSPLNIYGFKFTFYVSLQASLLAPQNENIFKSPFYSGLGVGCMIRNENLAFNTLQFYASYLPPVPGAPSTFFAQITSTAAFNFNIFALQAPSLIQFR